MKLLLLCLAALGVATGSVVPAANVRHECTLVEVWEDFYALLPTDKIMETVIWYLAEDKEVQNAVEYMQSDEFKALCLAVAGVKEYNEFMQHLAHAGLDVYKYLDMLHDFLGIPHLERPFAIPVSHNRTTGGLAGLVAEIKGHLPLEEIKALFYEKLATCPAFKELYEKVTSHEARELYKQLGANPTWQWIKERLHKHNVDIDAVIDWVKTALGWH